MSKPNKAVTVESLSPPDKAGYLTKQGGSIKTWKKRWFVLKGDKLYYFKTPKDVDATGVIELAKDSVCKNEDNNKKKNLFSLGTPRRTFFMFPDDASAKQPWMDALNNVIDVLNGRGKDETAEAPQSVASNASPRARISTAKTVIPFLKDEDSKVLEFWQIWSESIPPPEDLAGTGDAIHYFVACSADMQKLTWRTHGPQNIFIQKMVDFFWNVGAPETEIDRLNDVGALINPVKIGSWIDMSQKGGMDGGWFFPVDVPLKLALEAADDGEATKKVLEWGERHAIASCFSVGRDMGAAPPRQTEMRLRLLNDEAQLAIALDAFTSFGFPQPDDEALTVLRSQAQRGQSSGASGGELLLSVITSSEGFVRLGLMQPAPPPESVDALLRHAGGNSDRLKAFEAALGVEGPTWIEYQYLQKGFGYGVYKEGFDIVFHFSVGSEADG